jgi:hypothetical protein
MKKLFAAVLFFIFASAAHAQGAAYTAGPFNTSGLLYVCTLPVTTTPCSSLVSIYPTAALTGALTTPYPVIAGQAITFYVTPGQYAVQVPQAGFSQIVTIGAGGGGSASIAGNQNAVYASPICPVANTNNCYFVNANGQVKFDAVTTSNTTITCADCHFQTGPFPITTGSTVVWTINSGDTLSTNETTISAVVSDTQITIASPSSSSLSGQTIVWGLPDITTAGTGGLVSAWNATAVNTGAPCGTLYLPQGIMIVEGGSFNVVSAACQQNTEFQSPSVVGQGRSSTQLIPSPNFVWPSCGTGNQACFSPASPASIGVTNWSIYGAAYNGSGYTLGGSRCIIGCGSAGYSGFAGFQWCSACSGVTGMNFGAQQAGSITSFFDTFSPSPCVVTAQGINITVNQLYCNSNAGFAMTVNSSASLTSTAGVYNGAFASGIISVAGTMISNFDSCTPGYTVTCYNVGATGVLYLNNSIAITTTNNGATCSASGGKIYAQGSTFTGGSGSGLAMVSGCTFIDLGGNTFTGTTGYITETVGDTIQGVGVMQGSCTGTATSSTTLFLYGLGQTVSTCTGTTTGLGTVMAKNYTLTALNVKAGTGGFAAGSGVFTVLKNGASTGITCTVGTGTTCLDSTHHTTGVPGDIITIQFTTQATETLANVTARVFSF